MNGKMMPIRRAGSDARTVPMPFSFLRKYHQDIRTASHVPMPNEELLGLAQSLIDDPETGAILRQVGVDGDMSEEREEYVSDHVIAAVERYGWERPHPGNLLIPVALARRFAAGSIDRLDDPKVIEHLLIIGRRRKNIIDDRKATTTDAR